MQSYNLLFTINQKYFELSKLCLHSLIKNVNINLIDKIYIADTGLKKESILYFTKFSRKIIIVNTGLKTSITKDIHTTEWIDVVSQKTKTLYNLVKQESAFPLIMMDIDMFIVKDFSHVIDNQKEIQVCARTNPAQREDIELPYLGSFIIVNKKEAVVFIEKWITKIQERILANTKPPFETPALCEVIELFRDKIHIGDLNEDEISCDRGYIEGQTCIIHLKSSNSHEYHHILSSRIMMLKKNAGYHILKSLFFEFLPKEFDDYQKYLFIITANLQQSTNTLLEQNYKKDKEIKNKEKIIKELKNNYAYKIGKIITGSIMLVKGNFLNRMKIYILGNNQQYN